MRFVLIPQNGSSWNDRLLYSFDCESDERMDVEVSVDDPHSGYHYATLKLRNITSGEVDIAPYLRRASQVVPLLATRPTLTRATTSLTVAVTIADIRSEIRTFHRAAVDASTPRLLSQTLERDKIGCGETILATLFTPSQARLSITAIYADGKSNQTSYMLPSQGSMCEVAIPVDYFYDGIAELVVQIYGDGSLLSTTRYTVVERGDGARRLVWYNLDGGVESYTFPASRRVCYKADVQRVVTSQWQSSQLRSAVVVRELLSAYESCEQMERIAKMLFSPYLFCVEDGRVEPVTLLNRSVEFDAHDTLRKLSVRIEESPEGGVL